MRVSDLFYYPMKSARGIALQEADVGYSGFAGDRRAMVVDEAGYFITQRELPQLAQLNVYPEGDGLRLSMQSGETITALPSTYRKDVVVWRSSVNAVIAGQSANERLSAWLGRSVQIAFFDAASKRAASIEWTGSETPVTFADGYQVLVTTTGSLEALNADMAKHGDGMVEMDRFRPNVVIDCDLAWAEDLWAAIEINGIRFDLVKPCTRCIMTTQDQQTGSREVPNPMPSMGRLRMSGDRRVPGVLFGWNAVPRSVGKISLDDTVKIIEEKAEGWPLKQRGRIATANSTF